jgi:hypothetical protein
MILTAACRLTHVLPVPGDRAAMVVLTRGDVELAAWPLAVGRPLDLAIVDELARWQLAARRVGCAIRLRDACTDLSDLLAFLGLAEVVGAALELRLPGPVKEALQVVGEAEDAEEARVEEVVVPDDPVA